MPNITNNNTPSESDIIDELVDMATRNMRCGHEGHISSSIKEAIYTYASRETTPAFEEINTEHIKTEVETRIEKSLPEYFEFELTHTLEHGWVLHILSGCPNCGNDSVFNGDLRTYNQWVAYPTESDDSHCRVDDTFSSDIEFLSCACCGDVLVDTRTEK